MGLYQKSKHSLEKYQREVQLADPLKKRKPTNEHLVIKPDFGVKKIEHESSNKFMGMALSSIEDNDQKKSLSSL